VAAINASRADLFSTLRVTRRLYCMVNPAASPVIILALTDVSKPAHRARLRRGVEPAAAKNRAGAGGGRCGTGGGSPPAVRRKAVCANKLGVSIEDVRSAAGANANRPRGAIEDDADGTAAGCRFILKQHRHNGGLRAVDYKDLVVAYRNGRRYARPMAEVVTVENTNTLGLVQRQPGCEGHTLTRMDCHGGR
jgi:hypothetical protein